MSSKMALFGTGVFISFCAMIGCLAAKGYELMIADIASKRTRSTREKHDHK